MRGLFNDAYAIFFFQIFFIKGICWYTFEVGNSNEYLQHMFFVKENLQRTRSMKLFNCGLKGVYVVIRSNTICC